MHADKGSNLTSEAEALLYASKNNWALKKYEKSQKKTEAKKLRKEAWLEFSKAGEFFEKINLFKHAAQCYYTSNWF